MKLLESGPDNGAQIREHSGEAAGQHGPESPHISYTSGSSASEKVEVVHGIHGLQQLSGRGMKGESAARGRVKLLYVLGRGNKDEAAIWDQDLVWLAVGLETSGN